MDEKTEKPWVVRDVSERTRRRVKLFAVEYDVTMARALEFLVDTALSDSKLVDRRLDTAGMYFKIEAGAPESDENAMILAARVVDIEQRKREGKSVTDDEERLVAAWSQANEWRIKTMTRYRDEREALENELKKRQQAEETEEPQE